MTEKFFRYFGSAEFTETRLQLANTIALLSTIIFCIGLYTVCEYIAYLGCHCADISAWFHTDTPMAISTAISFMLTGFALFLIAVRLRLNHFRHE